MFCNGLCANNSTNFNNNCGCNSCNRNNSCNCHPCNRNCGCNGCGQSRFNNCCGCNSCGCRQNRSNDGCGCNSCGCGQSRTNDGCGWYCCPDDNSCSCPSNNFPTPQPPPSVMPVNLSYFTAASAQAVASQAVIPLTLARQIGNQIVSSGSGALLTAGLYEISYSLSGTSATAGSASVGLQLNGTAIPAFTQSATVTAANDLYNVSAHGIVSVPSGNSIVNLVNLGANAQNYTNVNLVIRKIA